jgi:hypothetical protein
VRVTVVAVLDVPLDAVGTFREYEDHHALPLLGRHGGRLERRLGTADGTTEVHVLSFPTDDAYRAYLADPERAGHLSLLTGMSLTQRVVESLTDVV